MNELKKEWKFGKSGCSSSVPKTCSPMMEKTTTLQAVAFD